MALAFQRGFLSVTNLTVQAKRCRGKINIQRPKPPHFERAKFLALTKPILISSKKDKSPAELCNKNEILPFKLKKLEPNPFQNIIAQELLRWFQTSKLIGFFHLNPMNAEDQFKAYSLFIKEKMHYKSYGKKTLELAIKGTPYEAVLDFYVSHNMIVFSPEPKLKQLFRISKKFPQLILLAGIYEGKFMNRDDLIKYSTIPNLETAQANLVCTLNSAASTLHSQLNAHQGQLLLNLNERVKQLKEE